MDLYKPESEYDLLFAGGGFSAAVTLAYVLDEIGALWKAGCGPGKAPGAAPVRIAVCDARGRFPKGLSYSEDEDSSAFMIIPASDMMPPDPGGGNAFTDWLVQEQSSWADRLSQSRNSLVKAWLPALTRAVEKRDFESAFFPRSVVGWFLEDLAAKAVAAAEADGYAQVDVRPLEIDRVQRNPGGGPLSISTANSGVFTAGQLVVAIGSGAFGALCPSEPDGKALMTAPLDNGVSALRRELQDRLQDHDGEMGPEILVIGSNASSLDVISVLLDLHAEQGKPARITAVSPSGYFPPEYRSMAISRPDPDPCRALSDLVASDRAPTAQAIHDCAVRDRQNLLQVGAHIGEAKTLIYDHVLKLIKRLDAEEKRTFVEIYGNGLSRQFFMTSPIYAQLYRDAIAAGQLRIISGTVKRIQASDAGAGVEYDLAGKAVRDSFDLVVDCSGFECPLSQSSIPLVQSLFADLGAQQNRSGRGFKTAQDSFEIAPDVFVLGPLFAGNVDSTGICRWHLETTRGIAEIARICAKDLVGRMEISAKTGAPAYPV